MAIKLALFLGFFLSGLGMYFFARRIYGERGGLLSAVLYQVLPYHVLDLFVRGAMMELFAFIWLPVILLYIRRIFSEGRPGSTVRLAVAYAGLILTHLATSFMFSFVMAGYGLYLSRLKDRRGIAKIFAAFILSLGLSSIFLLPVVLERRYVHIEFIRHLDYMDGFLFSKSTEWKRFYALLHVIVALEAFFFAFRLLVRKRGPADVPFFLGLLAAAVFLMTPLSMLIWRHVPEFSNLQFPWRWMTVSGLSTSVIAGGLTIKNDGTDSRTSRLRGRLPALMLFPLLAISLSMVLRPHFLLDTDVWKKHPDFYAPFEYRPIWLKNYRAFLKPTEKVAIIDGNGSFIIKNWRAAGRLLEVNAETPLDMRFSTLYFPGWQAFMDGKRADISINGDSGSMVIRVPEGRHEVELRFEDTRARNHGELISAVSLMAVALAAAYGKIKR